ncbi:MAG: tetratricopeptide repeat protein, partial [Planctomycetes bacterium]|nr:tetratricopeptide repeat protein [Planctomycetota bacterium]
GAESRIAYLEGRIRQRAGNLADAAEWFREAARLDGSRPEPCLRLADCLFAIGEPAAAEDELLGAVETMAEPWGADAILGRWIEESFRAGRPPAGLLARLPERGKGFAADLRWLLERLAAGEAVRINCGGPEFTSTRGVVWSADRFHARGVRRIRVLDPRDPVGGPDASPLDVHLLEIEETDDDPIYRAQRAILGPSPGALYRVPLPRGSYRVTFHFSEVERDQPGTRGFDVAIEGETVLSDFDPGARGFAKAKVVSRERRVDDGRLDLELRAKKGKPAIAGIEIEMIP